MGFSIEKVNSYLLHKQHLAEDIDGDVVQTAWDVGGLHATGATVPYLSLRARSSSFAKEHLEEALYVKRSLGKVLCMRNTLFILPKELLPVAYQATLKQREAHLALYLRHYGISRRDYAHLAALILGLLASGPETATEIKRELGGAPATKVALNMMPNDWQLIRTRPRGTWRSNLYEYASFVLWFPDVDLNSIGPEEAKVQLVSHYLAAFGPAKEEEIAWWSGFSKGEAKTAVEALGEEVATIEISDLGGDFLIPAAEIEPLERSKPRGRRLFLLPSLDPYIMGYKDRERFLAPEHYSKVFDRAGNALPTIWAEGRVVGVWQGKRPLASLTLLLFQDIDAQYLREIEAEAHRWGKFLGYEAAKIEIASYPPGAYPKSPFTITQRDDREGA